MSSKRQLPLRLCEVMEKEFISLHRPLPADYPDWRLQEGQLDLACLLDAVCQHANRNGTAATSTAQILGHLAARIPAEWLTRSGQESTNPAKPTEEQTSILLALLNQCIMDEEKFPFDITLLDADCEARQLAQLHSKTAPFGRQERQLVHRLLLEAALPKTIKNIEKIRLAAIFQQIHGLPSPHGAATNNSVSTARAALCLSGGGIRSAAFALGLLQGLAARELLDQFDYLSTVSGGGYVGSWLSAWIHRHPKGLTGVSKALSGRGDDVVTPFAPTFDTPSTTLFGNEAEPVRFLRRYSYFLTPKAGFMSADTWAWIGIYLRNLSLNWLALIPLLLLLLAVPRLYAALLTGEAFYPGWQLEKGMKQLAFWLATSSGVLAIICVIVNRPSISDPASAQDTEVAASAMDHWRHKFKQQRHVLWFGMAPLLLYAFLLTLLIGSSHAPNPMKQFVSGPTPIFVLPAQMLHILEDWGYWVFLVGWGELIIALGWLLSLLLLPPRIWSKALKELAVMLIAGLLTWFSVTGMTKISTLVSQNPDLPLVPRLVYAVLAGPATILACLGGMTLFIGLVSKLQWIDDEDYEWWARFGGWLLIGSLTWAAAGAIVIFGPLLLLDSPKLMTAAGGASGLLAVLFGKSALTPAALKNGAEKTTAQFAGLGVNVLAFGALLFLAVFLSFLSLLTSAMLLRLPSWLAPLHLEGFKSLAIAMNLKKECGKGDAFSPWIDSSVFSNPQIHLETLCQTPPHVTAMLIMFFALLVSIAAWRINLNKFSLHGAYRNRLIRTFLGASRDGTRKPNPFTGFDPFDNIQMHELQAALLREADILNLPALVTALKQGLDLARPGDIKGQAIQALVHLMVSTGKDKDSLLESRLQKYTPHSTVLKSLQRHLIERLNRVLQTERLPEMAQFQHFRVAAGEAAHYLRHGNLIFANRRLLEAAFEDWITAYDFPPKPPHKLLHMINLTLNLVDGKNLAWQERKASSFVVSPMHAGCDYLGFREARDFGGERGISLGTAATISGAAVSPNMGYSSSPLVTILLTLFNVRLGWWLGNPGIAGQKTFRNASPSFSLKAVVSEAMGLTDDQSSYVYLSDGGHFDNLGLYEMVLRRCHLIVLSDAGADPDYIFEDLANAVRKIRIDFGIPIEFDAMPIFRKKAGADKDDDKDGCYCSVGRIVYSAVDQGAPDGVLVYFKPAAYGRESRDIVHYMAKNPAFPQEPTSEQFFGEAQFESYRRLGQFAVEQVCKSMAQQGGGANPAPPNDQVMDEFVKQARRHCGQVNPNPQEQDKTSLWSRLIHPNRKRN